MKKRPELAHFLKKKDYDDLKVDVPFWLKFGADVVNKFLSSLAIRRYAEINHSDWLQTVLVLRIANQSAYFRGS